MKKKKKREIRQYVWCFALLALSGIQAYFIQREREMRERERETVVCQGAARACLHCDFLLF